MPKLRAIDGVLSRHRRATALVGTVIVLGVAALNVHAALPEHHHAHGETTVCIAALAVAGLLALGWRQRDTPNSTTTPCVLLPQQARDRPAPTGPDTSARAGPSGPAVLRL